MLGEKRENEEIEVVKFVNRQKDRQKERQTDRKTQKTEKRRGTSEVAQPRENGEIAKHNDICMYIYICTYVHVRQKKEFTKTTVLTT
jgi:hypothetical protein